MVPTPFTWRYGGQQVSVCGSFNGWTEKIPLLLVEGLAPTFQRVIDLPAGYHQYKFFVDGTWRVDEQKICAQDEYGTINNIVLVRGAETASANLHAEAFRNCLNSENAKIRESVGSSLGTPVYGPDLQLSDSEMDVSRNLLSMHLSSATAYDLMPNSGKVIMFDVEVAVEQAFHDMSNRGLVIVPLWDQHHGQIAGMLTASDFMLILLELHRNRSMLTNEELPTHTISAWKHHKIHHQRNPSGSLVPPQRKPLIQAGPDESLRGLASRILHNKISTVPIVHSAEDGSCPQLLHVACLSEILKHICRHFKDHLGYLPLLRQPIGYLPLGTWAREVGCTNDHPLLTLQTNNSLDSDLILLLEAQVSSVPILDEMGNLVNVYSRSDITVLAKDNIYSLVQLDQITMSQALEALGEAGRLRCRTCTRFDSLFRVMELLSEPDARRVIVVEASSRHVEGIITLRDVFSFILR